MTPQKDYRNRAAHVRRSARAHLKEIRRARLARKESDALPLVNDIEQPDEALADTMTCHQDVQPAPPDEAINHDQSPKDVSQSASEGQLSEDADAIEHAALAELGTMFDEDPSARSPVADKDVDEPEMATSEVSEPLPNPEEEAQVTSESAENIPEQPAEVPEQEASEPETTAPSNPVADLADSDLNSLPGAGPGLVWMLHQCGVSSLADLAASDPDSLSPKLGVVGQILDVGKWIEFASAETAATD